MELQRISVSQAKVGRRSYRPEVINEHVKHTQQHDQKNGAPLRLEADNHHDTRQEPKQTNQHTPEAPLAREDKPDKQENQQHAPSKLDVHLAILLIELRQARRDELLAHPRVGKHHKQAAHDAEVAEEEVQVEDQAVTEALRDDHGQQARDAELGAFPSDYQCRADAHSDNVND